MSKSQPKLKWTCCQCNRVSYHLDGVQCETCLNWSHAKCAKYETYAAARASPEGFLCNRCRYSTTVDFGRIAHLASPPPSLSPSITSNSPRTTSPTSTLPQDPRAAPAFLTRAFGLDHVVNSPPQPRPHLPFNTSSPPPTIAPPRSLLFSPDEAQARSQRLGALVGWLYSHAKSSGERPRWEARPKRGDRWEMPN
jgi:hypothetical protein